jgi:hypothetical protein
MTPRLITVSAALLFGASAVLAQQTEGPPAGAEKGGVAQECARIQRHDHGAERGFPGSRSPCKPLKSAAAKPKAKVDGHDHGKVHKNQ